MFYHIAYFLRYAVPWRRIVLDFDSLQATVEEHVASHDGNTLVMIVDELHSAEPTNH